MVGKIMWWSDRDGNGIILVDRKEYYFDTSTLRARDVSKYLKRGMLVQFVPALVSKVNCAKDVFLIDQ